MSNYDLFALLGTVIATYGVVIFGLFIAGIVARWRIFTKAGKPGWASIVPFYHSYIEFELFWGQGWLFLVPIVLAFCNWIPLIGWIAGIANVVIYILHRYKKAESFGERIGFTIGLIFLPQIFDLILAFGHYEYHGVPVDGVSYKEIKEHVDNVESKPVGYEAPPVHEEKKMSYDTPENSTSIPKDTVEKDDSSNN